MEKDGCPHLNTKENRGHDTILSEEKERELFENIKKIYIETNLFLDDDGLALFAKRTWDNLYPEMKDEFVASKGWVYCFKKRWRLSSYKGRNSKKAAVIDITEGKIFMSKIERFLDSNPDSFLFNIDETFWRLINGNFTVLGICPKTGRSSQIYQAKKDLQLYLL